MIDYKCIVKLLYPAECLHCEDEVEGSHQPLCRECLSQIEWLRRWCKYCKRPVERGNKCDRCQERPLYLKQHVSLFTPEGPLACLHSDFLQTRRGKTLAAFTVMGLCRLPFAGPDCVVPLLRPRCEGFSLKNQPTALLAKATAKLLACSFYLPSDKVEGKTVLLLTDWLSDGEWLLRKKQDLQQFFPKKIYSLALFDAR